MRETGLHAGRLLDATMRGEIRPRTLRAHLPMLDEANAGRTDVPETAALMTRAAAHEASRASWPCRSTPPSPRPTSPRPGRPCW
jgi:microcystin degradation protein MlrC